MMTGSIARVPCGGCGGGGVGREQQSRKLYLAAVLPLFELTDARASSCRRIVL